MKFITKLFDCLNIEDLLAISHSFILLLQVVHYLKVSWNVDSDVFQAGSYSEFLGIVLLKLVF